MRSLLIVGSLTMLSMPAAAEIWSAREGQCGEWQSRWNVSQEASGTWLGEIDHVHVGGPCVEGTGQMLRSNVRAIITGDNLFAVRTSGGTLCTHVVRLGENRGRGFTLCENEQRVPFAIRFRTSPQRPLRETPPDDELLDDTRTGRPGRRFQERGLDDWFGGE